MACRIGKKLELLCAFVKDDQKEISSMAALWRVFCISLLFWGAAFSAWGWQRVQQSRRVKNQHLVLRRVAARSKTVDRVPLSLLCSLLEIREGVPLFSIHPHDMLARIKACPAFSYARVWRLLPGTLGVEYSLRSPAAFLGGVRNVVFDEKGTLFFLLPFFAPKKLPQVVLDLPHQSSLEKMQEEAARSYEMKVALRMLPVLTHFASHYNMSLECIDLSKRNHPNIFRREIILAFSPQLSKEKGFLYVRCSAQSLSMKKLRKVIAYICSSGFHPGIIDMRFPSTVLCTMDAL